MMIVQNNTESTHNDLAVLVRIINRGDTALSIEGLYGQLVYFAYQLYLKYTSFVVLIGATWKLLISRVVPCSSRTWFLVNGRKFNLQDQCQGGVTIRVTYLCT